MFSNEFMLASHVLFCVWCVVCVFCDLVCGVSSSNLT